MNIKRASKSQKRENTMWEFVAFILKFFTLVLEENAIWELKHYVPSIKTVFDFVDVFGTWYYSSLYNHTKKRLLH